MNTCQNCGTQFEGRPDRPNKFCSHKCHVASTKTVVTLTCVVCKSEFLGYKNRQVCSLKCVHEQMRLAKKVCSGCGNEFAPEKSKTKFCSKECEITSRRVLSEPSPVPGARWIALTKGKFALVDEDDFERVSQHSWYAYQQRSAWYARSSQRTDGVLTPIRLHRFILQIDDPKVEVDHVNHDGLDCRRSNLRVVNDSQNRMNTFAKGKSGYKGVSPLPGGKFKAVVRSNNQMFYLGRFNTAEEAARAYDSKAREVHGTNGRFNFPLPGEHAAN